MTDLQNTVKKDLLRIGIDLEKESIGISFDYNEMAFNTSYNTFIFEDNKGDHLYVLGDRSDGTDSVYKNRKELLYQLYKQITFTLSAKYTTEYKSNHEDDKTEWRLIMFKKQLELLEVLGTEYKQKRELEISNLLRQNL